MLIKKYANLKNLTHVFLVNMTLEKPPWGKPVEEEYLLWRQKEIITAEILNVTANLSQVWQ
jgi:hypothetical protein